MTEKKFKNKNLFDYLKNILTDKNEKLYQIHISESGFDNDFKKVVLIKYLSMSPDENVRNIIMNNQFLFDKMDSKTAYWYLLRKVPRQNNYFIRFIK